MTLFGNHPSRHVTSKRRRTDVVARRCDIMTSFRHHLPAGITSVSDADREIPNPRVNG